MDRIGKYKRAVYEAEAFTLCRDPHLVIVTQRSTMSGVRMALMRAVSSGARMAVVVVVVGV